ncbi:MAG: hypothetical protein U0175_18485 [Caldilineaceae bacterium]
MSNDSQLIFKLLDDAIGYYKKQIITLLVFFIAGLSLLIWWMQPPPPTPIDPSLADKCLKLPTAEQRVDCVHNLPEPPKHFRLARDGSAVLYLVAVHSSRGAFQAHVRYFDSGLDKPLNSYSSEEALYGLYYTSYLSPEGRYLIESSARPSHQDRTIYDIEKDDYACINTGHISHCPALSLHNGRWWSPDHGFIYERKMPDWVDEAMALEPSADHKYWAGMIRRKPQKEFSEAVLWPPAEFFVIASDLSSEYRATVPPNKFGESSYGYDTRIVWSDDSKQVEFSVISGLAHDRSLSKRISGKKYIYKIDPVKGNLHLEKELDIYSIE